MTFMYLQNHTPMKANDRVMPFECFYNMKPDVSHIHTFGCVMKVVLPSELLGKLDDCAAMGYLLGYKYDGAYCVWIPKLGIRESRNVTFYNNTTPTPPEHGSITEVQQIQHMCTLKAPTITPVTPRSTCVRLHLMPMRTPAVTTHQHCHLSHMMSILSYRSLATMTHVIQIPGHNDPCHATQQCMHHTPPDDSAPKTPVPTNLIGDKDDKAPHYVSHIHHHPGCSTHSSLV
jgi:hypothetical protein